MNVKPIFVYLLFVLISFWGCAGNLSTVKKESPAAAANETQINWKAYQYYLDGALNDFQDQYEKALLQYYQALIYDSTSAQIHKAIGRDLMRLESYESAVYYLKKALKLNPNDRETYLYLAEVHFNMHRFPEAVRYFEALWKMDPYNSTVQNNLLYLYSSLKMQDKLLEFYRKMMEYYPNDVDKALQYALACIKQKKIGEAQRVLSQVVQQDSTQYKAYFMLGSLYEMQKDTLRAEQIYRAIVKDHPDFTDALTSLYRLYRTRMDWDAIIQLYEPVVRRLEEANQANLILGEAYFYKKEYDRASEVLQPLLENQQFRVSALELLGRIALEKEDYARAEEYLKTLIEEEPRDRYGWIFLALVYNQQRQFQKSARLLEQAVSLHRDDVDLLGLYGSVLDQMGETEKAVAPLEKALRLEPDHLNSIVALANVYDKLKMWEKCDSLYEAALRLYPDNPLLLNNYSYSLTVRGKDLDRALEMAKKAVQMEPNNGAYLDTMGWIYYQLGDYQKALEYVQKAVETREQSAEVLDHLGDIYHKLGQPEQARTYWQKALELEPDNQKIKAKLQNL